MAPFRGPSSSLSYSSSINLPTKVLLSKSGTIRVSLRQTAKIFPSQCPFYELGIIDGGSWFRLCGSSSWFGREKTTTWRRGWKYSRPLCGSVMGWGWGSALEAPKPIPLSVRPEDLSRSGMPGSAERKRGVTAGSGVQRCMEKRTLTVKKDEGLDVTTGVGNGGSHWWHKEHFLVLIWEDKEF